VRIVPLAEESLGVRSMCFYVETEDVKILLDAGVSLAPRRFGKPPHPLEFKALRACRRRILRYAEKAEIVTVSHYHLDHYTPPFKSWFEWCDEEAFSTIYGGKVVLIKDFRRDVNLNQMKRGYVFHKKVKEIASKVVVVDGKDVEEGGTLIKFSGPLPHGAEGSALGWVLCVSIWDGKGKLIYAPDVQGPASEKALNFILNERPQLVIIGGPPTYLEGFKVGGTTLSSAFSNLAKLAYEVDKIIIGHHLLRDPFWKFRLRGINVDKLLTAATFLGISDNLLEAHRSELYRELPPGKEYERWFKLPKEKRESPPPLDG